MRGSLVLSWMRVTSTILADYLLFSGGFMLCMLVETSPSSLPAAAPSLFLAFLGGCLAIGIVSLLRCEGDEL